MSQFYRYLRPLRYNLERHAVELYPRGGICFRITHNEFYGDIIDMSYSICHDDDVFDTKVARTIADNRVSYSMPTKGLATNIIARAVVDYYNELQKQPLDDGAPSKLYQRDFMVLYQRNDLRLLKEKIEQIWAGHRLTWQLDSMNREAIEALNLKKSYARRAATKS